MSVEKATKLTMTEKEGWVCFDDVAYVFVGTKERAELICLAVNSYEEMRSAIERTLDWLDAFHPETETTDPALLEHLRRARALAEGERKG